MLITKNQFKLNKSQITLLINCVQWKLLNVITDNAINSVKVIKPTYTDKV